MKSKLIGHSVFRKIVGSVLSSGISSSELEDFSLELMSNPDLAYEFAHGLRQCLHILDETPTSHFESTPSEPPWLIEIINRIQKSKIPKKDIIRFLPQKNISHISPGTLQKMGLREILLRALENSPQSTINLFIRRLGVESEPDPYLSGIEKKN